MNAKKDYKNCLHAMYSLRRFGIKLGLDTIRKILAELGNPQDRFGCVHVAGTNGKGSIASGIASILKAAGYRTGLYTSPHLETFNERISINGKHISNARVVAAYEAVKNVHHGSREPTFFEFATAMALYDFDQEGVDFAQQWGKSSPEISAQLNVCLDLLHLGDPKQALELLNKTETRINAGEFDLFVDE